jgi:N-acylglucosamine 2-epimerase
MTPERKEHLTTTYRDGLLHDTMPFWMEHALDEAHGGYFTALDRDGAVIDSDKSIWFQGRFAWLLATLYSEIEPRPEWLAAARSGIDFLQRYGFDDDGRMFFLVTREGRPLRKRRYVFSEAFAIAAYTAYARATGDAQWGKKALELFEGVRHILETPGLLEPKVNLEVRPQKGLAMPMILIVTAQLLRDATGDESCNACIDRCIAEIERDFMHPEFEAVLETVGPKGEFIDHYDGRTINPGHAIEASWFILQEARRRGGDKRLTEIGLRILDWSWKWGWDEEHGGILYFRDVRNLPVQEYWHDMKFWWPQNEAIIATLMAYCITRDDKYSRWHQMAHDWAYAHFPDHAHGEWFGYLHRDGSLASRAKGTLWKGPFHYPRMQLVCWNLMEEL